MIKGTTTFLFVYNADANLFSQATDFAHKIFAPETYLCSLCRITYGNFVMKKEWKSFLESLPGEKVFLHRDEFRRRYPEWTNTELPAIFVQLDKGLGELVTAAEIGRENDLKGLMDHIRQKVAGRSL